MDKENKNIGGRLAANFRRANIAEGLAIQMFPPLISMTKTRKSYRNFHIFLFFKRPK